MTPLLTHIALHIENLPDSVTFYQKYCQLAVIHRREKRNKQVVWMAEPGREHELVMVFIPGGPHKQQQEDDFSHLGFALASKEAVDNIASQARDDGILLWPPVQEDYPVGYYCGVKDPNGTCVEFSYGQPLGPGSEEMTLSL